MGGEIFRTRPDLPWGPTSLLYNRYWVFPGGKAAGVWCWPPTPSSAEVEGRVELYLYSPSGTSWPVLGVTFTFTVLPLPLHCECSYSRHIVQIMHFEIKHTLHTTAPLKMTHACTSLFMSCVFTTKYDCSRFQNKTLLFTVHGPVRIHVSQFLICGGQCDSRTVFLYGLLDFPQSVPFHLCSLLVYTSPTPYNISKLKHR